MSNPSPTFGKRGIRGIRAPPPAPPSAPSAAHLELAAAARLALRGAGAPEAFERFAATSIEDGDDDMRVFIGPRWGAYRGLWAKMKDAPRLMGRQSFVAGSLSSVWLLYRKQYRLGAAILAAQAAMLHTEVIWSSIFDLGVATYFGRYGLSIVLCRGAERIARIRAAGASSELTAIRLGARGGVNWVAALSGTALLIGIAMANFSGAISGVNDFELLRTVLDRR